MLAATLIASSATPLWASRLPPVPGGKPWQAHTNSTVLDLTEIPGITWPVTVFGKKREADFNSPYKYVLDPTGTVPCNGQFNIGECVLGCIYILFYIFNP